MNENNMTPEDLAKVQPGQIMVERRNFRHVMKIESISADPTITAREVVLKSTHSPSTTKTALGSLFTFYRPATAEEIVAEIDRLENDCEGHPAGEHDPMGKTVYCDGSCRD